MRKGYIQTALKFVSILALFAALAGCREQEHEWFELRSGDTGFWVMMPGEPKEYGFTVNLDDDDAPEDTTEDTPDDTSEDTPEDTTVEFHVYRVKVPGHHYIVVTSNVFEAEDLEELMKTGIQVQWGKWKLDDRDITYNGYPGKEWIIKRKKTTIITRAYLAGTRYYQLTVKYKNRQYSQRDVELFFNSFRLIE